jgi:hypothetical protein
MKTIFVVVPAKDYIPTISRGWFIRKRGVHPQFENAIYEEHIMSDSPGDPKEPWRLFRTKKAASIRAENLSLAEALQPYKRDVYVSAIISALNAEHDFEPAIEPAIKMLKVVRDRAKLEGSPEKAEELDGMIALLENYRILDVLS